MQLGEYLKGIEQCPEEFIQGKGWRLTREFGIYDNMPIFLKADYDEVVQDFLKSGQAGSLLEGRYRLASSLQKAKQVKDARNIIHYVPGTVLIQALNWVSGGGRTYDTPVLVHHDRQAREFNMTLMLHLYQWDNQIPGVSQVKVLSLVTIDIGQYIQKKGLPACFPRSIGWDYEDDFSRVVYFNPELARAVPHPTNVPA